MKIGTVSVASVILLLFAITGFITKHFYPSNYAHLSPYLDGALFGGMLVVLLYYVNIYISAWLNNRKEESLK